MKDEFIDEEFREIEQPNKESQDSLDERVISGEEMVAYILSGEVRTKIFVYLTSKNSYAYKIAKDIEKRPMSVIRSLNGLKSMKVVKCINPDSHRRKFYELTSRALKIKDKVVQCDQ